MEGKAAKVVMASKAENVEMNLDIIVGKIVVIVESLRERWWEVDVAIESFVASRRWRVSG